MKSIWKGVISFGLVSIPVQLFSAVKEHMLGFKLLCEMCHTPIEYQRWCPHCEKKVAWADVVKGLEIKKGEYVILTQEKIKELKPETTNAIDIFEFVDIELISPIYYDNHYYLAPVDLQKNKAYVLFKEALRITNKAAIGKFVMHEKEHICALQFYEDGILLSTLHYAYEIRSLKKINMVEKKYPNITASELKLAQMLIKQLAVKKFDISEFKDSFAQELLKLIKSRKKGKVIALSKKKKIKEISHRFSLEDVLKESLEEARA